MKELLLCWPLGAVYHHEALGLDRLFFSLKMYFIASAALFPEVAVPLYQTIPEHFQTQTSIYYSGYF
jgi:hypothetical protein